MNKHLLLCLLSFCLLACTKSRSLDKKELYLLTVDKIAGFDPINMGDSYSSLEGGKVFESLYEFHPYKRPYQLVPNLAQGLPEVSPDGLSYLIHIQKGVRFQDDPAFAGSKGREMTADDIIFSIMRLADPHLRAKNWWLLDDKIEGLNEWRYKATKDSKANYQEVVSGLQKIDSHSIRFKLKKPFPQFLYALAHPATFVVAREVVAHYGPEFLNHPVGTGPFILKSNDPNRLVYEKNPSFRSKLFPNEGEATDQAAGLLKDAGKKLPLLDRIIVDVMVESQPRWFAFQRGKLDLLTIPPDNFNQAMTEDRKIKPELAVKGMSLFINPLIDVTYIAFNHLLPIFQNVKVRQAFSLAYNREEANRLFYQSSAQNAMSVIPPGLAGYDPSLKNPFTDYNLERARQLMTESGYPLGKGFPQVTFDTMATTEARQMAEHFQKNMADLGVKVKISMNTWPELTNKVSKGAHQIYPMAWLADYPDAENFLSLLYCPNKAPGSNGSNYCNPKFDQLFKQASLLQDSPERKALYQQMNLLVVEESPWIFSFHRTKYTVKQGWVENFKFMEFNHTQHQYLNIDLDKKKQLADKF